MKLHASIPAALVVAAFSYAPSFADCVDVTNSVSPDAQSGIAKDGTHAPLEGSSGAQTETRSATGTTTTSADAMPKTAQKDGSAMPMGETSSLATSGQDVAAQQKGDRTAAASAGQNSKCD